MKLYEAKPGYSGKITAISGEIGGVLRCRRKY